MILIDSKVKVMVENGMMDAHRFAQLAFVCDLLHYSMTLHR